jgi:hypothetical protein
MFQDNLLNFAIIMKLCLVTLAPLSHCVDRYCKVNSFYNSEVCSGSVSQLNGRCIEKKKQ